MTILDLKAMRVKRLSSLAKVTTGRGLSAGAAFVGLADYGLFAEKMPPCFTSVGLSNHVNATLTKIETETDSGKQRKALDKLTHSHIRYQSLREINVPRQMVIPHPESYLTQCLVIKRCWKKIKTHCAKPSAPVSRIFVRKTSEDRVFKMNYEGEERFELEDCEIGYQTGATHMVKADISKCFSSIYTHSVPWAIHGRPNAKKNRANLTLEGNLLDRSCQSLADSQTNGIGIGPHSSNIIAELILTKIDASLLNKGHSRLIRHIDDYTFYATSYREAEAFIRDLNMELREYELCLNEKKTGIVGLPQPTNASWVNQLKQFQFPSGDISFSTVRAFLDLALELARSNETSSVLNYAIRMMPKRLNARAKRLFGVKATNLCLAYPYLCVLMQEEVFERHRNSATDNQIEKLGNELIKIGIERIYPDSIAYSLYWAIEYGFCIDMSEKALRVIISLDDCLSNVLLWEYSKRNRLTKITRSLRSRASNLKGQHKVDLDAQWLLIYTILSENELRGNGQSFLADLKKQQFAFTSFRNRT